MNNDTYRINFTSNTYRINFIAADGTYLVSTEFTEDRNKIVYLADLFNDRCKHSARACVETRGSRVVDTSSLGLSVG
jgi:hypothetical protein